MLLTCSSTRITKFLPRSKYIITTIIYMSRIFYSNRRTFSSRKIDTQDLIRNFSNSLKLFLSSYTVPR